MIRTMVMSSIDEVSTGGSNTMESVLKQHTIDGASDERTKFEKILDKECNKLGFSLAKLSKKNRTL